tara:strand:+ start:189 stop:776 length:588 start_codon:yes stop_codon:yes gene_type:complete
MKVIFGKYCGKDITEIIKDKNYKEWLLKQSFVKEKYPEIYNAVINYKKPLRKINYNNLPNDIIEYINSFNATHYCGSVRYPLYYPLKKIKVDKGALVLRCKAHKYIDGLNKGKTFKEYSWGYTNCLTCGIKIANDDSNTYYFLCSNCNSNSNKSKPPLKTHDENTTNNLSAYGMPIIKNNKVIRVNEIPDFCLFD